jgi:purine-binding chemotaxis protein CheW
MFIHNVSPLDMLDEDFELLNPNNPKYFLFRQQGVLLGLSVLDVVEIVEIEKSELKRVTNIVDTLLGVTNLRGAIVSVLDFGKRVSMFESLNEEVLTVIMTKRNEGDQESICGLAIKSIVEVDGLDNTTLLETPIYGLPLDRKFVSGISTYGGEEVLLLDISKVLEIKTILEVEINDKK